MSSCRSSQRTQVEHLAFRRAHHQAAVGHQGEDKYLQEGHRVVAIGHGPFQDERDEIRAQDSQNAAENRTDQPREADFSDADVEHHHADSGDHADSGGQWALDVEWMEKVGREGQNCYKKKPDDKKLAHCSLNPAPGRALTNIKIT